MIHARPNLLLIVPSALESFGNRGTITRTRDEDGARTPDSWSQRELLDEPHRFEELFELSPGGLATRRERVAHRGEGQLFVVRSAEKTHLGFHAGHGADLRAHLPI